MHGLPIPAPAPVSVLLAAIRRRRHTGKQVAIRSGPKAFTPAHEASTPPPGPSCFLKLRPELRIKIYKLVFSPILTVVFRKKLHEQNQRWHLEKHWRYSTEPQETADRLQVRYCDEELPISERTLAHRQLQEGHPSSLSGILFANKPTKRKIFGKDERRLEDTPRPPGSQQPRRQGTGLAP